jgi:hypothetical protein
MTDATERLLTALTLAVARQIEADADTLLRLLDDVRRERERREVEARR